MKLSIFKSLNQRGALHLAAPLLVLVAVAVVGTGMLVYSRAQDSNSSLTTTENLTSVAQQATGVTGGAKAEVKNSPTGYLVIFSGQGKYGHAAVYVVGDAGDKKCGSKKFSKGPVVVALKAKKPTKLRCTAGQTYNIFFLKKGQKTKNVDPSKSVYASTGLNSDHCSFVHHYGVTRVEAAVKGKCVGDNDPNENAIRPQDKVTPVISQSVSPNPVEQGKKIKWQVTVRHPGAEPLSPEECAGQLTTSNNGKYGLKFNKKTSQCEYKRSFSTKSYKPGAISFGVKFAGNKFLNPAESTTAFTVNAKAGGSRSDTPSSNDKNRLFVAAATLTKTGPLSGQVSYTVKGVNCNSVKATHKWKRFKDGKLVQTAAYKKGDGKKLAVSGSFKVQANADHCLLTGSLNASRSFTKSENKGNEIADSVTIKAGKAKATSQTNKIGIGN